MIQLPSQKSKPMNKMSDFSILLYGYEKIGKTSLASQFPDALFLMCEPGGKSLEIYQVEIKNWIDIKDVCTLLDKSKGKYKNIVIDTVDIAFNMCQDYVCKKLAIQHPSEEDFGKAWTMIRDEFIRVMSHVQKLGLGVIFISHAEEKEIKRRGGESTDRVQPTLAKQGRKVLEPMVDLWACYTYTDKGERELIIRGDSNVAAGCRIRDHFTGISRIPMGRSEKDAYELLIKAFNNQNINTTPVPVKKLTVRR